MKKKKHSDPSAEKKGGESLSPKLQDRTYHATVRVLESGLAHAKCGVAPSPPENPELQRPA